MFKELKIDNPVKEKYEAYKETTKISLVYPLDNICIVCKKPTEIHMKEGRLHNDGDMSVKYEDGWGIYSLNGVSVPEWLALEKWNKIDPLEFAKIDNAEVRREFVRKVGIERIVEKCGSEVLDKQGDYELILVDLKGETGKHPYLKMKNPSIGVWHLECVDKTCQTVQDALNWRTAHVFTDGWNPSVLT
jgi:hypothetical protein